MKRTLQSVVVYIVGTLMLLSLNIHPARADWDAALEAREAAQRKAEQQQAAKKKAENEKTMRDAGAKAYREALGKEAIGKSDAEVERIFKQRQADAVRQAKAASASGYALSGEMKKNDSGSRVQHDGDAQMKSMTGKSVGDLEKMSAREREAFARDMEKKFGSK